MLYSSNEDAVVEGYFSFTNDIIGILALTLAATALQFEHPEPFAWFFLLVIILWTFTNTSAQRYKRIAKRYTAQYGGIRGRLQLLSKMIIYAVGVISLYVVAQGVITKAIIYKVAGF